MIAGVAIICVVPCLVHSHPGHYAPDRTPVWEAALAVVVLLALIVLCGWLVGKVRW